MGSLIVGLKSISFKSQKSVHLVHFFWALFDLFCLALPARCSTKFAYLLVGLFGLLVSQSGEVSFVILNMATGIISRHPSVCPSTERRDDPRTYRTFAIPRRKVTDHYRQTDDVPSRQTGERASGWICCEIKCRSPQGAVAASLSFSSRTGIMS